MKVHGRFRFALIRFGIKHFTEGYCDTLIRKLYQNPELANSEVGMQELLVLSKEEKRAFLLSIFNKAAENNPEKITSAQQAEELKVQHKHNISLAEEEKMESKNIGNNVIALEVALNVLFLIFAKPFMFVPVGSIVILASRFAKKAKEEIGIYKDFRAEKKAEKKKLSEEIVEGKTLIESEVIIIDFIDDDILTEAKNQDRVDMFVSALLTSLSEEEIDKLLQDIFEKRKNYR